VRHPRLLAALLCGAVVAVLVVAGLGAGATDRHPSNGPPITRADATAACVPPPAGTVRLPAIDGRVSVVLHVPPHAKAGAALVLGLPGSGQTARDFASYTGYSRLADRRGFFVAYPTATGARPSWNISGTAAGKPDDVAYLRAVIAAALKVSCASPRRVGVTGVSNGGGMSARLACDAADLVSAAAPVAGGYGSLPGCRPARPVAILEIHGTGDQVVPYAGKGSDGFGKVSRFLAQWRRLDGCPAAVRRAAPRHGVAELTWAPCRAGTAVVHERIAGEPHGWPGQDDLDGRRGFSSTARTWAFLSAHRR
jgi:polyhydroxybutyrate depolymerase